MISLVHWIELPSTTQPVDQFKTWITVETICLATGSFSRCLGLSATKPEGKLLGCTLHHPRCRRGSRASSTQDLAIIRGRIPLINPVRIVVIDRWLLILAINGGSIAFLSSPFGSNRSLVKPRLDGWVATTVKHIFGKSDPVCAASIIIVSDASKDSLQSRNTFLKKASSSGESFRGSLQT